MEHKPRRRSGLIRYILTAGTIVLVTINALEYISTINKLAETERVKGKEYAIQNANRIYSEIDEWQEYIFDSGTKLAARSYIIENKTLPKSSSP
ncbi:hypothetical protein HY212_07255 [Candidatus Pacearchaeota archaeon]|nr:hypothetical protein [Candidatus Pacearchaeota archaeon]